MSSFRVFTGQLAVISSTIGFNVFVSTKTNKVQANSAEYTLADVQQHNSSENGLWVSFGDGVFDVTDFYAHNGGRKYVELAAGGRLEPFWTIFRDHLHSTSASRALLEQYRIGTLAKEDRVAISYDDSKDALSNEFHQFAHEPVGDRPVDDLIVMRQYPFLAEAVPELLGESFFTPNELFYTRNHFPVPHEVDTTNYSLDLHIDSGSDVSFDAVNDEWDSMPCDVALTLDEIKNGFENVEIAAALQCSGNRGSDVYDKMGIKKVCCKNGFISNAKWKGVRIRDVMLRNGYDPEDDRYAEYKFMTFYGSDTDLSTMHYAMSVPIDYVMNKSNDCLLVWEMNGVELPRDHGYPLRALLPGNAGCRSVKWLKKIQLTKGEVENEWQQRLYQPYRHRIYDMPVTSIITKYEMLGDGRMEVHGFAWSGGGRGILKVEVSTDDGETWTTCDLEQAEQESGKQWAWTLWKVNVDVTSISENKSPFHILCRALDSSFNSQPRDIVFNGTMYCNNAWHSVPVDFYCDC